MSKFKVGDWVEVVSTNREMAEANYYSGNLGEGHVGKVTDTNGAGDVKIDGEGRESWIREEHLKPAEDRTTWHPHHDVIVAWAKGAKVRGRPCISGQPWRKLNPQWFEDWEYEVIPDPDHIEEIADIERKMRELSESQKELADRLEKLK